MTHHRKWRNLIVEKRMEKRIYKYDDLEPQAKRNAIESLRRKLSNPAIAECCKLYAQTLDKIESVFAINVDIEEDKYSLDWTFRYFDFKYLNETLEDDPDYLLRYLNQSVLPYIDNRKTYCSKNGQKRKSKVLSYKTYNGCLTGNSTDCIVDIALNNIKISILSKKSPRDFVDRILIKYVEERNNTIKYINSEQFIVGEIYKRRIVFLSSGEPVGILRGK